MMIAWGRVGLLSAAAIASAAVACLGQPFIHGNDRAADVIVTTFSILAGFLVAIMTLLGDPSGLGRRSWRGIELRRSLVFRRIERQKLLFVVYLITLLLILVSALAEKHAPAEAVTWLERGYLFFASLGFMASLWLPWVLSSIQLERYDEALRAKRGEAGIKD